MGNKTFDIHFDKHGARAITRNGVNFLWKHRNVEVSEELYPLATKEGLRVSFENNVIFDELTAIPAFAVEAEAASPSPCVSIY